MAPPVCLIDFGSFISFHPCRIGVFSTWQTCRTQLVIQECQLHHLLIRHGMEDNQHQSTSVSLCFQLWMDIVPVDVADRRQRFSDIWRPYTVSDPARQCWGHAWLLIFGNAIRNWSASARISVSTSPGKLFRVSYLFITTRRKSASD